MDRATRRSQAEYANLSIARGTEAQKKQMKESKSECCFFDDEEVSYASSGCDSLTLTGVSSSASLSSLSLPDRKRRVAGGRRRRRGQMGRVPSDGNMCQVAAGLVSKTREPHRNGDYSLAHWSSNSSVDLVRRRSSGHPVGVPQETSSFSWPKTLALFPGCILMMGMFTVFVVMYCAFFAQLVHGGAEGNMDLAYIQNEWQEMKLLSKAVASYTSRPWPISVRDEEANFEFISHPADTDSILSVPKFFLTGNDASAIRLGNGKLLTRRVADKVGSYTTEKGRYEKDLNSRTIFVSILSFRDWRCRYTVEGLFARAKYPERIRVGVVDQIEEEDPSCDVPIVPCDTNPSQALCRFHDRIDVYEMESVLGVGSPFARHIANRMYRGEYYTLYLDSHVKFVQDWDVDLIGQFQQTGNDMAVLSTYLSDVSGNIDESTGKAIRLTPHLICNSEYVGVGRARYLRHDVMKQPDATPLVGGRPQLQPFWTASFSFSRGHFVLTVPYDPHLSMVRRDDEEISMAIRAFTNGYDFYAPARNVCFDSSNDDTAVGHTFAENDKLYKGAEKTSLSRLYGLIGMNPEDKTSEWSHANEDQYGVGKVRETSKFFNTFGVHVREKITERNLCDFVSSGRMNDNFQEYLRNDGMGIDYSQINYRFHELQNIHDNG